MISCSNRNKRRIQFLNLDERILYLIYISDKNQISIEVLRDTILIFDADYDNFDSILNNLRLSKVIKIKKDIVYFYYSNIEDQRDHHRFLRTLYFFHHSDIPVLKSKIKNFLRFNEINLMINRLLLSGIFSVVRYISNKKHGDYVFYTSNYDKIKMEIYKRFRSELLKHLGGNADLTDIVIVLWEEEGYERNSISKCTISNNERRIIDFVRKIDGKNERMCAIDIINILFGTRKNKIQVGKRCMIDLIRKHILTGNVNNGEIRMR